MPFSKRRDLEGNFIDVLRGKDQLACNADLGCACLPKLLPVRSTQPSRPACAGAADRRRQATMVAIKMAVESFLQSKTLLWDGEKEKLMTA